MLNEFIKQVKDKSSTLNSEKSMLSGDRKKLSLINKATNTILNKQETKEEAINALRDYINQIELSEVEKEQINFVLDTLNLKIEYDSIQTDIIKTIQSKIKGEIHNLNTGSIDKKIDLYTKLFQSLESNDYFESFDELNEVFIELNIPLDVRFELLKEIGLLNYQREDSIRVVSKDKSIEEYDNSDEDIINLLKKCTVDYSRLDDTLKLKLKKYLNISTASDLIDELSKIDPTYLSVVFSKNKALFVRILLNSNVGILHELKNHCEKYKISFIENLRSTPTDLIPNRVNEKLNVVNKPHKGSSSEGGTYNNFIANCEFFFEKGYDVEELYRRNKTIFHMSYLIVKRNYYMVSRWYDLRPTDTLGFSAFLNGKAIENLDRFIEISPIGYEYVKNNSSRMSVISDLLLYNLKISQNLSIDSNLRDRFNKLNLKQFQELPIRKRSDRDDSSLVLSEYDLKNNGARSVEEAKLVLSDSNEIEKKEYRKYDVLMMDFRNQIDIDESLSSKFDYIKELETNYRINKYLYQINDTRISRIKFLRICTMFNKLYSSHINLNDKVTIKYALLYNSIVTDKDVLNIDNFLSLEMQRSQGGL